MGLFSGIAFWVAQANDAAGALAPWGTSRNTTGGGETWTSGQRWSTTALSWARRATDPGNQSHSKAANQDWSTSASQWKSDYDTAHASDLANAALAAARLAAGSGSTPLWQTASLSVTSDTTLTQAAAITPSRTGAFWAFMRGQCNEGGSAGNMFYELRIDSVGTVDNGRADAGGTQSLTATVGLAYGPVVLSPSNVVRIYANKDGGSFSGTLYLVFIPTPTYPH